MIIRLNNFTFAVAAFMSASAFLTSAASAHGGRRFDIQVNDDNQLIAQGYDSNAADLGIRPYVNSIHDHFNFNEDFNFSAATLPSFNILNPGPLNGGAVELTLLGSSKWQSPPAPDGSGAAQDFGDPILTQLDDTELISINLTGSGQPSFTTADGTGTFLLADNINANTANADIDLDYTIGGSPTDVIYVLEWQLSTDVSGISDSDSVFTILSPDGNGVAERLHFQSLAIEEFLGTPVTATAVPEPGSLVLLSLISLPLAMRRKR